MRKRVKVGAAFSDYVYSGKQIQTSKYKFGNNGGDEKPMREFLFPLLFIIAAVILVGRLFFLQIIKGSEYNLLSDTNRTRTTIVHAPRGVIFGRNGKPLVYNTPGFRLVENKKTTLIDNKTGIELLAQGKKLEIDSLRSYPYKDAASHIVGYVGQISADELSDPEFTNYQSDEVIGKMGIEQSYEKLLKGIDGQKLVEVDATGKAIRTLGETDPIPGQNITLTIDADLQQKVYDAMKSVAKGAAIVSKPNGEILAMVSKPSFDPNLFTLGEHYSPCHSGEEAKPTTPESLSVSEKRDSGQAGMTCSSVYPSVSSVLLDGNGQPLLDRAIGGTYPPGSTFKLITAAAGLEDKIIDAKFTIEDTGILKIGDFSFANWAYTQHGKTDGEVDVIKAIARSNDIFFYKLGQMVGVDRLADFGKKFGLGQKLGIDIFGERSGLMPTKEWKERTLGEQWYLGDNYHIGIGQGYLLTTPLQVNYWTQIIANGGTGYEPHLFKKQEVRSKTQGLLTKDNFDLIRQGMIEACQTGGVAWPLFNFGIKNKELGIRADGKDYYELPASSSGSLQTNIGVTIACKTGTAQHGDEQTLPHSWITLFAPAYNPQVVVTVLAESSGEGSNVAGPVAKSILESYFNK